eukprot:Skav235334  [mRNA]  locus=scaffold520:731305:734537:- [translate_table: standard]
MPSLRHLVVQFGSPSVDNKATAARANSAKASGLAGDHPEKVETKRTAEEIREALGGSSGLVVVERLAQGCSARPRKTVRPRKTYGGKARGTST